MGKGIRKKKTGGWSLDIGEFRWKTGVNRMHKSMVARKKKGTVRQQDNLGEKKE